MPNVVMEAMACGLPVVATAVGGLPAAIGDCKGAVLVQPKNTNQIKEALLRIISDVNLQNQIAAASRKRAEEKFDITRNTQIVINRFMEIINEYKK
jgi:glycosyltransferase involved in cell wall biosynthesis